MYKCFKKNLSDYQNFVKQYTEKYIVELVLKFRLISMKTTCVIKQNS